MNTLEITGSNIDMNNLITITAATDKRHFYLNDANATLILRYLKLIGGDVSSNNYPGSAGGSILIYENGGELNLYSSIVFNNKAGQGAGINAYGTNKNVIMNIYDSIIQNNEAATDEGGGFRMYSVVGNIYNTTIDNNQATTSGGGMFIDNSDVKMKNTIVSNNKAGSPTYGGGGLFIRNDNTVILRQSSFINNDATNNGDEIYTYASPTISLINTYFNNTNNNNNIYVDSSGSGTPTWKTCSDNLCTETPFTGTCNAVNNVNSKLGVLCNLNCSANQFAPLVSVAISAPSSSDTCKPWQTCDAGYKRINGNATIDATCAQCGQGQFQPLNQFNGTSCQVWQDIKCDAGYRHVNGNATYDATCVQCSQGQFQPLNQFNGTTCQVWQDAKCNAGYKRVNGNTTSDAKCVQCSQGQFQPENQFIGTSCTNWKQCNNNESISFNGNRSSDRICALKPTTTTAAPSVTTTTEAVTSTTAEPVSTATTTAASLSITTTSAASANNTASAAPLSATTTSAAASTSIADTTTTKSSPGSRSTNAPEDDLLSNSIVNTVSTISIIIIFILVICNL
jgi:hypothetical protein